MTKRIRKLNIILFFAICLSMLFSVTAYAKSANYKKLYKKFLAKGTYETSAVAYSNNYRNGKVVKRTTKHTYKIDSYAVANIDGKGAPELLLFSKQYRGKNPLRSNSYFVNVAYIKGKKVKIIPTYENTTTIGKKTYKSKGSTITRSLKEKQVKFYPALSLLNIDTKSFYYNSELKKAETYEDNSTYEYKGGLLKYIDEYSGEDSEKKLETMKNSKPSVAKILANTKKNRNKSFK